MLSGPLAGTRAMATTAKSHKTPGITKECVAMDIDARGDLGHEDAQEQRVQQLEPLATSEADVCMPRMMR
jgi:hypothetical protein